MLLLTLIVSLSANAQKRAFTGVVIDTQDEPVIGASVIEKGTSNGSVTDFDGRFTVTVNPGATLVISYVGCVTQEVKAADNMRVTLRPDDKVLDEVVVIGYGVQKKSVVTPPACRGCPEGYGRRCQRHLVVGPARRQVDDPHPWYRHHQRL